MGWTTYGRRPADPRAELRRLVTWTNEDGARRVLADSMVGTVWYAAVEHIKADGERVVWAAVFLTTRREGWGYKDMDETCGPNEDRCPRRILELLTPTDRPYAVAWRERCWARINAPKPKAPKDGDLIRFRAAYQLGDGPRDSFVLRYTERRGRKVARFYTPEGAGPYRLGNWRALLAS